MYIWCYVTGPKPTYLMTYRFNNRLNKGPYKNSKVQPADPSIAEELYQSMINTNNDIISGGDTNNPTNDAINSIVDVHQGSSAKHYELTSLHMLQFIKELSLSKSNDVDLWIMILTYRFMCLLMDGSINSFIHSFIH